MKVGQSDISIESENTLSHDFEHFDE
jgi:hypothetical protein